MIVSVTVAPDYAERLGSGSPSSACTMIDAPISGGGAKAATGEMTVMASGPPEAFASGRAVLDAIAAKVYRLGDAPGTGSKVKIINQLLAGVHIAAAAEAMALGIARGRRSDGAVRRHHQQRRQLAGCSRTACRTSSRATTRRCSAVDIFVKDLGIVLDTASESTLPAAARRDRAPDVHAGRRRPATAARTTPP